MMIKTNTSKNKGLPTLPKPNYTPSGFIQYGAFSFAPGFRSILFQGIHVYDCSKSIAQILDYLFDYFTNGCPRMPQQQILMRINERRMDRSDWRKDRPHLKTKRLRDLFKTANGIHPLWGTLIKSTKGRDAWIYIDFEWNPFSKSINTKISTSKNLTD